MDDSECLAAHKHNISGALVRSAIDFFFPGLLRILNIHLYTVLYFIRLTHGKSFLLTPVSHCECDFGSGPLGQYGKLLCTDGLRQQASGCICFLHDKRSQREMDISPGAPLPGACCKQQSSSCTHMLCPCVLPSTHTSFLHQPPCCAQASGARALAVRVAFH